jgi:hypothetical protein
MQLNHTIVYCSIARTRANPRASSLKFLVDQQRRASVTPDAGFMHLAEEYATNTRWHQRTGLCASSRPGTDSMS